ncbi:MAG: bacteriohemerythrin [Wujia sp.]
MFEFTDDCKIGIEQIDKEHQHLFNLIYQGIDMLHNQYVDDHYNALKELLYELENYADEHFAHEEAYMESIRDPEVVVQRTQHMFFREKIREWSFYSIAEEEQQRQLLEELLKFLAKWLYHHIIGSDSLIGKLPPLEEWMIRENPCEFTQEYMTGIELIDEEHKVLFEILERANRLVKDYASGDTYDAIMEILQELKDYTVHHFADEEAYMESIHYQGLEAQKRAHEAFVARINGIREEDVGENPGVYLESLMEFLIGWLIQHILHADKKIGQK